MSAEIRDIYCAIKWKTLFATFERHDVDYLSVLYLGSQQGHSLGRMQLQSRYFGNYQLHASIIRIFPGRGRDQRISDSILLLTNPITYLGDTKIERRVSPEVNEPKTIELAVYFRFDWLLKSSTESQIVPTKFELSLSISGSH